MDESVPPSNDDLQDDLLEGTRSGWLAKVWLIVSLVINLSLLGFVGYTRSQLSDARDELVRANTRVEQATSHLGRWQHELATFKETEQQAVVQKRIVRDALRQYRTVDDFPRITSPLGICCASDYRTPMNGILNLVLPQGNHRLEITFEKTETNDGKLLDRKVLSYDLIGESGYQVVLDHPREEGAKYGDPRQLTLKITSNNEAFDSVDQPLFTPFRTPSSSSSSGGMGRADVFFYPNQFDRQDLEPGVVVNSMRWSIVENEGPGFQFKIVMRVHSDGPLVADPDTAAKLRYRQDYQATYWKSGMYRVESR